MLKKIEIKLKKFLSSVLRFLLYQKPLEINQPRKRILIIRYGGLGDMIISIPIFKSIRKNQTEALIDVLCDKKNVYPILQTGLTDNIYYYTKKPFKTILLIFTLRKNKYDYVINLLMYPSFTFSFISRLVGNRAIRAAALQNEFGFYYNRLKELPPRRETHILDQMYNVAEDLTKNEKNNLQSPWIEYNSEIKFKAAEVLSHLKSKLNLKKENHNLVAVNLSAGLKRREWLLENYAELLNKIIPKYDNLIDGWVILCDPSDLSKSEELLRIMNHSKIISSPHIKDFRVMMVLIKEMFILITPDTSLSHAASAMGTAALVLMIGENIKMWTPVGIPNQIVASPDQFDLKFLRSEKVASGFDELIKTLSAENSN